MTNELFKAFLDYLVLDSGDMNLKLNFVLFLGFIVVSVRTSDLEKDNLNGNVISKRERTEEEKQKYKYWKVRLLITDHSIKL